jgi:hypothetical protein
LRLTYEYEFVWERGTADGWEGGKP